MQVLNFIVLITIFAVNLHYAVGDAESFYQKLRQQASTCETGENYDITDDGCSTSCQCVSAGVMRCDDNDCQSNGGGGGGGGNGGSGGDASDKIAMFQRLRGDATSCSEGEEINVEDCGSCTCVMKGVLNCQLKNMCLPSGRRSGRPNNKVSTYVMG